TITLVVLATAEGQATNVVSVSSAGGEPVDIDLNNNTANAITTILPPVKLSIRLLSSNMVEISWPAALTGYFLQMTESLTNSWVNAGQTPRVIGGRNVVTNATSGGS